ncbi:hypothetical protein KJ780_05075 [Candidatus Micrarchaeota archaeon]|nr:hypothetical protein [Candidatus Micrarchaeota archaeon]
MRRLVIFLMVVANLFAACNGTASHYLPAIVGDQGKLINISMEFKNGSGDVFVSIYPEIGLSTQESVKTALAYTFEYEGVNEGCDVFIKAHTEDRGHLDGPSGGAAFAIMSMSVLEEKPVREDAMITGSMDENGYIGAVGGLYEKAKIAKESGLDYFITPRQSLYDRVMLRMVSEDKEMVVIEVENISQAREFLLERNEIEIEKSSPLVEEINTDLEAYEGERVFGNVTRKTMELLEGQIEEIDQELYEEEMLGEYYSKLIGNQQMLLDKGYEFSAANSAFLAYAEAGTVANYNSLDLPDLETDVEQCIENFRMQKITEDNFEWVGGEELRLGWAKMKIDDVKEMNSSLREDRFYAFYEGKYAEAWFMIANMLLADSPETGKEVDENSLKGISEQYLSLARGSSISNVDMLRHLKNAENLHSEGKYVGAIIDSVYVIRMTNSSENVAEMDDWILDLELEEFKNTQRDSFWSNVYASHASFLVEEGNKEEAYRLYSFAQGLEEAHDEMLGAFEIKEENETKEDCLMCGVVGAVLAVILIFATLLSIRLIFWR